MLKNRRGFLSCFDNHDISSFIADLRGGQNDAHVHSVVAKADENGLHEFSAIEQPSMQNDGHFVFSREEVSQKW